jgi:hypothetical protein
LMEIVSLQYLKISEIDRILNFLRISLVFSKFRTMLTEMDSKLGLVTPQRKDYPVLKGTP